MFVFWCRLRIRFYQKNIHIRMRERWSGNGNHLNFEYLLSQCWNNSFVQVVFLLLKLSYIHNLLFHKKNKQKIDIIVFKRKNYENIDGFVVVFVDVADRGFSLSVVCCKREKKVSKILISDWLSDETSLPRKEEVEIYNEMEWDCIKRQRNLIALLFMCSWCMVSVFGM